MNNMGQYFQVNFSCVESISMRMKAEESHISRGILKRKEGKEERQLIYLNFIP